MTEMKDLGKGLFFFAWLQGAQMKTPASANLPAAPGPREERISSE